MSGLLGSDRWSPLADPRGVDGARGGGTPLRHKTEWGGLANTPAPFSKGNSAAYPGGIGPGGHTPGAQKQNSEGKEIHQLLNRREILQHIQGGALRARGGTPLGPKENGEV